MKPDANPIDDATSGNDGLGGGPLPTPGERLAGAVDSWTSDWESRRKTSVVLLAVCALSFLIWSATASLPLGVILCAAVLVAIALSKRRFYAIPIMLAAVLATPLIENFRFEIGYDYIFVNDWWWAVSLMVVTGCGLQHLQTTAREFRRWRLTGRGDSVTLDKGPELEAHGNGRLRVDVRSLLCIPVALGIAGAMLWYWSIEMFTPNRFRFDGTVYRVVVIGWLLTLAVAAPMVILAVIRWRFLSPEQAEIHLRRSYAEEADGEHRLLERARVKQQRRG